MQKRGKVRFLDKKRNSGQLPPAAGQDAGRADSIEAGTWTDRVPGATPWIWRKEASACERIEGVQKLAVLRANGLGDFLFSLPALEALHATYPQAELVLLALPWHAAFLSRRPSPVDRIVEVPPYGGVSAEPHEAIDQIRVRRFFQAMRQERFDLACQFHGGGHFSNPFVRQLGARITIGLKAADAEPLDRWIPYNYFQSEYARYLEAAALAGARLSAAEPYLYVTEQDRQEAGRVLPEESAPLAILHPGARDPGRRWPAEKFALLADALVKSGLHVVLTGSREERELATRVEESMHLQCSNISGQLSLGGLAAMLTRSHVVIANDTGPLHLAHAVGARTVGIYWCMNILMAAPLSRLRHRPLISWQLGCPVCGCDRSRSHCAHTASFVSSVSVDDVLTAAHSLLELSGSAR